MQFFSQTFAELPDYRRITDAIETGNTPLCVTGLSLVHKAQLALTLSGRDVPPLLLVTGTEAEAIRLVSDINAMAGDTVALHFPSKDRKSVV